jgi:hypothetical protein
LTRVKDFLTPVLLHGRIISADALYAQTSLCHEVIAAGGDYLLFVKGNQPTLYEDLALFFREPPLDCRDWRSTSTTNKGHGRLEHRLITVSTELNDFLARDWYGVGQVFCVRRRVEHALKCTRASRVWDHQPHAKTGRSRPRAGIDSRPMVDRKSTPVSA